MKRIQSSSDKFVTALTAGSVLALGYSAYAAVTSPYGQELLNTAVYAQEAEPAQQQNTDQQAEEAKRKEQERLEAIQMATDRLRRENEQEMAEAKAEATEIPAEDLPVVPESDMPAQDQSLSESVPSLSSEMPAAVAAVPEAAADPETAPMQYEMAETQVPDQSYAEETPVSDMPQTETAPVEPQAGQAPASALEVNAVPEAQASVENEAAQQVTYDQIPASDLPVHTPERSTQNPAETQPAPEAPQLTQVPSQPEPDYSNITEIPAQDIAADQMQNNQPAEQQPAPEQPAPQQPTDNTDYSDLNARIAQAALSLVGVTDGWQCTEVAAQALADAGVANAQNMWPQDFAAAYGYYTDNPQPGNLIYYNQGGNGVDHIAIYVGNGMAVHGNMFIDGVSYTRVAPADLPTLNPGAYIQVTQ